ncbi:hypothetical protein L0222_30560 [bacterium]|nr:hypothetical protein [bacterium]MCI0602184.1 hypothetical protein [bacterium]
MKLHAFNKTLLFPAIGALFVTMLSSQSVSAQAFEFLPAWTHTASSCAIDEDSLPLYRFQTAVGPGSDFTFRAGQTSTSPIIARCNVVNPLDQGNPAWNAIILGYQDPDGIGTNHSVRAKLFSVSRPTGSTTLIAFVNSNTSGNTGRTELAIKFSHSFDFLNNEYFVQIELIRKNQNAGPVAFMVRLTQLEEI